MTEKTEKMNEIPTLTIVKEAWEESKRILNLLFDTHNARVFKQLIDACLLALVNGNKILIAGNGGSHADAMHFAEELTGRFDKKYPVNPIPAMALGTNPAYLTCVTNDYGFSQVYTREIEAFGLEGDVFIALTASASQNVMGAYYTAKKKKMDTFLITGAKVHSLFEEHKAIRIPSDNTTRIQEAQMFLLHTLAETIVRLQYAIESGE